MKILIVEDDEMIADVISRGLSRAGYQCLCAYRTALRPPGFWRITGMI